jgi:HEAT repeat protein
LDDADPRVTEGAVRARASVGGDDAHSAMAVMLDADDSNLRAIAAQKLGESKNPDVGRHLAKLVDDPDQTVACVAISALEEVKAADQGPILIKALDDERWRVRAAAAEALGKLRIRSAADHVTALLDDPDPFVVTKALEALSALGRQPSIKRLDELAERVPALTAEVVRAAVRTGRPEGLAVAEDIFDRSDRDGRRLVVEGLVKAGSYGGSSAPG